MLKEEVKLTREKIVEKLNRASFIGYAETGEGVLAIVRLGRLLIAGGTCNMGLLPSYLYLVPAGFDPDEVLSEFIADIEESERGGSPSDELIEWGDLPLNRYED